MNRKQSAAVANITEDPRLVELRKWQASKGRLKENEMPWIPRYKKEIPSKNTEPLQEINRLKPEQIPVNAKPPLSKRQFLRKSNVQNVNARRIKLENWQLKNDRKNAKEIPKPIEVEKKVNKEPIKSTIPRPMNLIRKSPINFVERNKKLASKIKGKASGVVGRRITVAALRRSSLEKAQRSTNRHTSEYYCLKPNVSRKLGESMKITEAIPESSGEDFVIFGEDRLNDIQIPAERRSMLRLQTRTSSHDFAPDEPAHWPKSPEMPNYMNYNLNLSPLSLQNTTGKRKEVVINDAVVSFNCGAFSTPKPILHTHRFYDNYNVRLMISPLKFLPSDNKTLYTLTPVRRSARLSVSRKSSNVFADMNEIPSSLRSNTIYRENPALTYIEDGDGVFT